MPPRPTTTRHADPVSRALERAATGDGDAFAEVYDAVSHRVYGIALRVVGDPHQAEEVAQETLVEVWRNAARFDATQGSAGAWISTMAHHRAVDRVRSSSATRRRDTSWHGERSGTELADTTFDEASTHLRTRHVFAAMTQLPAPQRRAIELAYFGGHTYSDVARLMQAPLGTTKTRIRTALRLLRATMDASLAETA